MDTQMQHWRAQLPHQLSSSAPYSGDRCDTPSSYWGICGAQQTAGSFDSVNETERKRHEVNGEKRERERERGFGEFWLTGRHMARLVFLSVFCLCLRASCLSQAGRGAAETGSLMRHRGRARERRGGEAESGCGRNSTAANPALFHLIYIISSLPQIPVLSLPHANQLSLPSGQEKQPHGPEVYPFTQTHRFIYEPHKVVFSKRKENLQTLPSHTPVKLFPTSQHAALSAAVYCFDRTGESKKEKGSACLQ